VVDIYSNYVDQWLTLTVTEPVTPPTTVTVTGTGSYSVSLSWSGATATAGINHYNIYRDGTLIGNTTGTTYTDTTAAPGTTYSYKIKTVDNNSVLSSFSSATGATTATSFDFFTPLL
jgi:fibronectin type 3 domain-containing protein